MAHALRKLRAMGADEIAGRVGQAIRLMAERRRFERGTLAPQERLRLAVMPEFAAHWPSSFLHSQLGPHRPLFAGARDREGMRQLFASRLSREAEVTRAWAARAVRGEFEFFGRTHHLGVPPDWHADPVSGLRWPVGFHADAERASPPPGDVKDVWELNRHQFVADLAKAVFLFDDEDAWRALKTLVLHWIESVPYATGIPWACALEPAYRSLAWLWAMWLCRDHLAADAAFHLRWSESLYDHGRFLHDHLELYSSPYNHLVGEATALYLIGLAMPEVAAARGWCRRGRSVLVSRLPVQFYEDGGSVEQATFYHHATLGFYLQAALAGRHRGDEFPREVWDAVACGLDYSMWMTQPDGRVPAIGDTDDGKSVFMERRRFWDFRHFLAAGAVLFGRGDLKAVAAGFWEDAAWLLGPGAASVFDDVTAAPPRATSRLFAASGVAVMRSGWEASDDFVCVDVGEQAGGLRHDEVPSAAHGHADALSVVASARGAPVLVDAGFYTYNGDRAWERFFRETAAHNTVRIDGRDQARHLEKMAWCEAPRVRVLHWQDDEHGPRVVAEHDGYARRDAPVMHRRLVWRRPSGVLLVVDRVSGIGRHEVEANFLLSPDIEATIDGSRLVAENWGVELYWAGTGPVQAELRRGGPSPEDGWAAGSLGVRRPAPRLRLAATMSDAPVLLVAVLSAGGGRVTIARDGEGADARLRLRVPGAGEGDLLTVSTGSVVLDGPVGTLGLVAVDLERS